MTLAVFDFDGTLVDGDAGVHFAKHHLWHGYLEAFQGGFLDGLVRATRLNLHATSLVARALWVHAHYATGRYDRHRMVERAYHGFRGLEGDWTRNRLTHFARDVLPKRLRGPVVDRMREHADRDDHVVVISTGVRDLIWPLREVLGIDFEVVACNLRQDEEGVLTGTVEGPLNGQEKAMRLVAIAKRRGHDLSEVHAYGDHEDDAVLLDMVGHPTAVHPTKRLERIARERAWPVMRA